MKSSISIIVLALVLISVSRIAMAQDNPWKQNSKENPWSKTDSIESKDDIQSTLTKETSEVEPKKDDLSTSQRGSSNGNEIMFRYTSTRVLIDANSNMLDKEMNKHIRRYYKSRGMFWSNFGVTIGSITTSIVSGSPVALVGILGGAIASGFNSNKSNEALSAFIADNPKADQSIINKYKRKLRSKKIISGIGGIGAGLGATITAGLVIIIVAIATF